MHPPGQPPPGPHVYGLRCIRCGTSLDLPTDPRLVHIDCSYCGQDNVLPDQLIQARQRQHEIYVRDQAQARAAAQRIEQQQRKSRVFLITLFGGGFAVMTLFGACLALGLYASKEDEAEKLRARDPKVNGHAALLARFEKMRKEQRCDRILVQPSTHHEQAGPISLDMQAGDHCVHVMGDTGTNALLAMTYEGSVALTRPLPAPAQSVDYRLCASKTAPHAFAINATPAEPFTVAAIECPRSPEEGGSRAKPEDPMTTGRTRLTSLMKGLVKAGCKGVVAEPKVSRGPQTFTLTSPANAACFNMLIVSYYSDVRFGISLKDPAGKDMAIPAPAQEMRVAYCPTKAGKYELTVTPNTGDHFAHASVDCPRNGAEGLKRLRLLTARD